MQSYKTLVCGRTYQSSLSPPFPHCRCGGTALSPTVLGCTLHPSSVWSFFLYMVGDMDIILPFKKWLSSSPRTICYTDGAGPVTWDAIFVIYYTAIGLQVYFWASGLFHCSTGWQSRTVAVRWVLQYVSRSGRAGPGWAFIFCFAGYAWMLVFSQELQ